jgi:phosphoglycolate phosphatase
LRLIIFDLDGTLVDSLPDLTRAVNAAMAGYGFAPVGMDQVGPWVGRGSRHLLALALRHHGLDPEAPGFDFEAAFARFMQHYGDHLTGDSHLFDGVAPALAALSARGIALAVCTNKPERFVAPLLNWLGIAGYFGALLGGDSLLQRKPAPEPLLYLAQRFDAAPTESLMVGDSRHDIEAARAAGMAVAGVRYGYAAPGELQRHPPDVLLDSLAELPAWLDARGVD